MKTSKITWLLLAAVGLAIGCGDPAFVVKTEPYKPAFRQEPPEPVYSRVTWSHLPYPAPPETDSRSPLLRPSVKVEFVRATLGEAIRALAKDLHYDNDCPSELCSRTVTLHESGTLDQILENLSAQAKVIATVDHEGRLIRVSAPAPAPLLEESGS